MPATPAPARLGRRERRRAETRARLFRAALELFAERGFTATTVADITESADVGKGTFFNYFPTKEHVLGAFAEMQLGKVQAAVAEASGQPTPIHTVLDRLAHRLVEEPGRSPALVRGMLVANLSSEPVRAAMQANLARARRLVAELLSLGQKRGEIRRDLSSTELARVFQQTFFGALVLWALNPAAHLKERLSTAFEVFWSGIRAPAASMR